MISFGGGTWTLQCMPVVHDGVKVWWSSRHF